MAPIHHVVCCNNEDNEANFCCIAMILRITCLCSMKVKPIKFRILITVGC